MMEIRKQPIARFAGSVWKGMLSMAFDSKLARGWASGSAIVAFALMASACGGAPAKDSGVKPVASPAPGGAAASATAAVAQDGSLPHAADPGVDGFSGQKAYEQVVKQVSFGPRPPGSDAIHKLQDYMLDQLHSYGCKTDVDDFHASTPKGSVAMKNIIAKIPGASPNIILLGTHYDTKLMPNFVGANDAGSSTGVMLEIARVLCGKPQPATIWIAFFDGEEAFNPDWGTLGVDNTYGSREMAAKLANSGELSRVKALVLADMVGIPNLKLKREDYSTPWLVDIVWATAAKLGYKSVFTDEHSPIDDDHMSFTRRKVPAVDIIDLQTPINENTWHTAGDVLAIVKPQPLQIVGDVILASLPEIAKRIR
jgi:glutaminyl-peptide cyclotransferase